MGDAEGGAREVSLLNSQGISLPPVVGGQESGIDSESHHASTNHASPGANPLLAEMEAPWANDRFFFVDLLGLTIIAAMSGIFSYGYNYVVGDLLEKWLSYTGDREYPKDKGSVQLLGGAWQWILIVWGGCTFVGILKAIVGLDKYPSFLVEIRAQHADPKSSFKVLVCCMLSLLSGAALGPEAGLAAACGAFGTLMALAISRLGESYKADEEKRTKLFVVGGICAAFGTIMPAPWVSLLICMECSIRKTDTEGTIMSIFGRRTLFLLGITATLAFVARYAMDPIPPSKLDGSILDRKYDNLMPLKAVLLGAIGAATALGIFVIGALVKAPFELIGRRVENCFGEKCRIICLCSLAGLVTGVLGYLVPFSLTDGKTEIEPTLMHALPALHQAPLTSANLFLIALTKTVSYGAANAGGLVGGPFFPVLYIGVVVGVLAARIPGFDLFPAFTIPVVMVSVPAAIFPIPFTMVAMPISMFNLGPLWCVPILVGIITSYTLLVGSGLVKKLAAKGS
eukprot:TRINITY_DN74268_c0_g1_i1.p1 TRINITY_DN74268_c0_g1~~TRINITY_DN74268_c0_g1_i1.p1  ORF type:complete len:512 (+),score=64.36 TRINITY_DN74268_c0_g1_i1:60-1595(+)